MESALKNALANVQKWGQALNFSPKQPAQQKGSIMAMQYSPKNSKLQKPYVMPQLPKPTGNVLSQMHGKNGAVNSVATPKGNVAPAPQVKSVIKSPNYDQILANLQKGFQKYGNPPIATMSAQLAKVGQEVAKRGGNPYLPAALTLKETGGLRYKPAQAANNPAGVGPGIKYPNLEIAILGGGDGGKNGGPQQGMRGVLQSAPYNKYYETGQLEDFFARYTPSSDPRNASYQKQVEMMNELLAYFENN